MEQKLAEESIISLSHVLNPLYGNSNNELRIGDWICLFCNNLNFAFRKICNRCLKQTKMQNYNQTVYYLEKKINIKQNELKKVDYLNNSFDEFSFDSLNNPSTECSNNEEFEKEEKNESLENKEKNEEEEDEEEEDFEIEGFKNMILLTPPKKKTSTRSYEEWPDKITEFDIQIKKKISLQNINDETEEKSKIGEQIQKENQIKKKKEKK